MSGITCYLNYTVLRFKFNNHVLWKYFTLDWKQTGEGSSWKNGQPYIYRNICILPSTVVSQQNRSSTQGRWSRSSWFWLRQFTQCCIYINRKCSGENPAYVSWAKRNAHALRAKSETCQKEETDFQCWDSVFPILTCFCVYLIYYFSFFSFLKVFVRNTTLYSTRYLPGLFTLYCYIAI